MKSEYINCKNCKDDCRCVGKDITPICIAFKPVKTTRADRIRAMTDEELAELFDSWVQDCDCNAVPCHNYCSTDRTDCKKNWLDWLKQEVT